MHKLDQVSSPSFDLFGVQVEVETLKDGRSVIGADLLPALIQAVAAQNRPNLAELQRFSAWLRRKRSR
ncbi:hypothetical protein [Xanthomonas euvesicatoria]|uniref:hypothetical protein n=1 Tax=Xanthomonas euvesicatoria TaxID=456327 RepID=UPI00080E82B3|nr:hypothetical protein [Xanthomonas euvesicatoria]MCC8799104.1 hypothetical protein [Xanthomonas euvesicatoria pv. euvesicatoria]MCC8807709.1 hypothetical protein [Xanthomonas euvesicatoria pv. euvesicatoria]MCC8816154.1 hypothetical protein [Xanthomonas euvesicatoria pv. euvesicatoria]MDO7940085.1 hypothetical protein [Xanthomonas euvesicatoria pv. eucalypti]MDO7944562.1 hypothetical protein [Xanthomonas euvesicatoria pv. eucalypti]